MARLIDAYALQDAIQKSKMENPHKDPRAIANHDFEHDHFMQLVAMQPTAQEEIVRCKNCIHKGKVEKCVLAAIAAEKGFPLFMLDNRGEWFCADGKSGEAE